MKTIQFKITFLPKSEKDMLMIGSYPPIQTQRWNSVHNALQYVIEHIDGISNYIVDYFDNNNDYISTEISVWFTESTRLFLIYFDQTV